MNDIRIPYGQSKRRRFVSLTFQGIVMGHYEIHICETTEDVLASREGVF